MTQRPSEVFLQWHEAAAVVHMVAEAIAGGRLVSVPALARLAIDEHGLQGVAAPGDEAATRAVSRDGAWAPPALRSLFLDLVGSNAIPPALARAIDEPHDSAAAFSAAVGPFVRPARESDRRLLGERLRQFTEELRLHDDLAVLTRRARSSETHPPDDQAKPREPRNAPLPRKKLAAVAFLGFFGTLIVLTGGWGQGTGELQKAGMLAQGQELLTTVRDAARSLVGTSDAAAAITAPEVPPTRLRAARASSRASRETAPEFPLPAVSGRAIVPMAAILSPGELVPGMRIAPTIAPAADTLATYDASDATVHPPLLVRPRLPSEPPAGSSPEEVTRLEVIVAPSGVVERVRLLTTSPERRYHDAMLLSAVKAWVFTPAHRDGVPVRYRLEIPLTS